MSRPGISNRRNQIACVALNAGTLDLQEER
jgi:hypothetical protein